MAKTIREQGTRNPRSANADHVGRRWGDHVIDESAPLVEADDQTLCFQSAPLSRSVGLKATTSPARNVAQGMIIGGVHIGLALNGGYTKATSGRVPEAQSWRKLRKLWRIELYCGTTDRGRICRVIVPPIQPRVSQAIHKIVVRM